ncbi:helicase 2-like protein, partial [Leptotrombidium deliense]
MMLIGEQMKFLEFIDNIHSKQCSPCSTTERVFVFVTGEAGTGKSYLLINVVDMLEELDPRCTLVVAYTGYAAINVKGSTIHAGLKLQIDAGKSQRDDEEIKEKALQTLEMLTKKLSNLKWLIIDEISLVSDHFFGIIDLRLRSIKKCNEPFGGVNVLVFGDLLQLPPVSAKPIYANSLWKMFKMYQLKYIHRQES